MRHIRNLSSYNFQVATGKPTIESMQEELQDPDDSDIDREDEDFASSEKCPSCGKPVYEDVEICPRCGHYISQEDSTSRKPLWIVLTAGVCVAVILVVWVLLRM